MIRLSIAMFSFSIHSDKCYNTVIVVLILFNLHFVSKIISLQIFFYCRQKESITIYPADVILFEGILTIYFKELRDMLDMKLFVDSDSDTRLSRRGINDLWYLTFPLDGCCPMLFVLKDYCLGADTENSKRGDGKKFR